MAKDQIEFIKESEFTISCFGPPCKSGVYAVMALNQDYSIKKFTPRILYIGSSKNIQKRTSAPKHPYRLAFDKFHKTAIICIGFIEIENGYLNVESDLIRKYRPLLNRANKWL